LVLERGGDRWCGSGSVLTAIRVAVGLGVGGGGRGGVAAGEDLGVRSGEPLGCFSEFSVVELVDFDIECFCFAGDAESEVVLPVFELCVDPV
jgi:hypothetical protein